MDKKDPRYLPLLEKAIEERWGPEAIKHPLKDWDDKKEEEYKKQLQGLLEKKKFQKKADPKLVENAGFYIDEELFNKDTDRTCSRCNTYSFSVRDDLYMNKFGCCYKCYLKYSQNFSGEDLLNGKKKTGRTDS